MPWSGHECRERAEPGLVALPGFDGVTVDRLTRLPLAGRLDDAGVALGSQARLVPGQVTRGDHTTSLGLRVAHQFLVIDFEEALRGQHPQIYTGRPVRTSRGP